MARKANPTTLEPPETEVVDGIAPDELPPDDETPDFQLPRKPRLLIRAEFARYTVDFPDDYIEMVFDQVTNARGGEITAELTVTANLPGYSKLLHEKRMNLLASDTQSKWAKYLTGRTKGLKIDWDGMLEEACIAVKRAFRQGEPPRLLRDAQRPSGETWILRGLVMGNSPTIWFGDGSSGKSMMALAAAIDIHTGEDTLMGIKPVNRLKVLYIDFEYDQWEHYRRMKALCHGADDEDLPDIVYLRCQGSLADQVDRIQKTIAEHEIQFLILDSIGPACGGEPESADVALKFFDALRQLNLGCLCIAHESKSSDHERPFGSVFWHNMARCTYWVFKAQDEGSDEIEVGLYNKKANAGRKQRALGYKLLITGDEQGDILDVKIRDISVADSAALSAQDGDMAKIRTFLRKGSSSAAEIAAHLGKSVEQTVRTLTRLETSLEVIKVPPKADGIVRYGLRDTRRAQYSGSEPPEVIQFPQGRGTVVGNAKDEECPF